MCSGLASLSVCVTVNSRITPIANLPITSHMHNKWKMNTWKVLHAESIMQLVTDLNTALLEQCCRPHGPRQHLVLPVLCAAKSRTVWKLKDTNYVNGYWFLIHLTVYHMQILETPYQSVTSSWMSWLNIYKSLYLNNSIHNIQKTVAIHVKDWFSKFHEFFNRTFVMTEVVQTCIH